MCISNVYQIWLVVSILNLLLGEIEYFQRCGMLAENGEIAKFQLDCC